MNVELTHRDLVEDVARRLAEAGVPSARVDARWLVDHVVAQGEAEVTVVRERLEPLVLRRCAREPLQLVLGSAAFRTVEVRCAPGVFVPRPETEVVAGHAIDHARGAGRPGRPARVVEPCTGTGAISCALLAEVDDVEVVATDLSPAAVTLARENVATQLAAREREHRPGARAEVRSGDLLAPVDPAWRGTVDVLVANPPYLPAADRERFPPEVADHDPDRALVGGGHGHEVVDRLLDDARVWLRRGGVVVLEIDSRRGGDALIAAARAGLTGARVLPDLTGADRVLRAQR